MNPRIFITSEKTPKKRKRLLTFLIRRDIIVLDGHMLFVHRLHKAYVNCENVDKIILEELL